jgi:hypothetical protein
VVLLDDAKEQHRMGWMAAVHARLAGDENIEIPDLMEERLAWEDWLMSELPKVKPDTEQDVVYAALFKGKQRRQRSEGTAAERYEARQAAGGM